MQGKRVIYILASLIAGAGVGYASFLGYMHFQKNGFNPIAYVAGNDANVKLDSSLSNTNQDGFYYKPLVNPESQIPHEGKAVYADLDTMTLTLYQDGAKTGEFSIKSKGRPGSFWETPTGEYRALTKEEQHFSSIGAVWMPYSIGFFGNFFIHGWPSYPSGAKVSEGFSGGCIRLATEDAKRIYDFTDVGTVIIVAGDHNPEANKSGYLTLGHSSRPRLSATAYMAADLDNHFTFLERGREDARSIASVTKLMTAAISLEAINQELPVQIDKEDLDIHGDSGQLVKGETFKVKDLLAPLLLSSSNDAAYALARMIGRTHFVDLMNQKATALGLTRTHFTDPSGLEMTNVSTPEDQLYFLKYLRDVRAPILEMSARRSSSLTTDKETHTWYNFNWKSNDSEFIGGKIGYIDAAGKTMVALFHVPVSEFATRDIGIVVLNSQDQEHDVREILSWIKSNFVYAGSIRPGTANGSPVVQREDDTSGDEKYEMLFVGDVMMDRGIRRVVENTGKGDYSYPFARVRSFLSEPALTFANLEGPISDVGSNHGSIYSFRMDPAVTKALYDVGFDIVSIANNHMGDWGREALEDTMRRLRRAGIAYTGAGWNSEEATGLTVVKREGQRIGFLGFSDVGPNWIHAGDAMSGIAIADTKTVTDAVRQAHDKVDILIVSFHYGDEYKTTSSARQRELSRAAIDAGARVVIGTHPHVAEEVEMYNGGVIAYSLGNFIFDQAFSDDTREALAIKLHMKGKNIERVEQVPIVFNETFQPAVKQ